MKSVFYERQWRLTKGWETSRSGKREEGVHGGGYHREQGRRRHYHTILASFGGGRAARRWRKRGGVLLWALPRGESGRAKGITDVAPTVFKPKLGKGEEGVPARRYHAAGKGGGPTGGGTHPCVVGWCDRGPGAAGWVMLRCWNMGRTRERGCWHVDPTQLKRIQTNSNGFKYDSNDFNSIQTSFDPNRTFMRSKKLK
jgi:hypothetical protein